MAYKILGQANLSTTNNTDIYTVPAGSQAVVSTLDITSTELNFTDTTIYVRKNNGGTVAAASRSNALVWEFPVEAYNVIPLTIGITLAEGDVITAKASNANSITIHVYGNESEL